MWEGETSACVGNLPTWWSVTLVVRALGGHVCVSSSNYDPVGVDRNTPRDTPVDSTPLLDLDSVSGGQGPSDVVGPHIEGKRDRSGVPTMSSG